ncbi:hypothetical protein [Streptomyces aureoverticillatus]|uniref:hypothetical protein n=1 Tax=Streptomyces aureoverticillatus TaxID=66871 RepID=UPI0013DCAC6A|nr:hypothetical protein [Streptomyces aureoverticillatus]QIB42680.1 hypothetical protein G3H79_05960 [Streptomyces aureoverticillatus]
MQRTRNHALAAWVAEQGLTETEFAGRFNAQVAASSGRPGNATARTVRRWLSGEVRWPHAKQREALTRLTGLSMEALGFTAPVPASTPALASDEASRQGTSRHLKSLTTATATASATVPRGPQSRVGVSDVRRLATALAGIVAADDRHGGTTPVETRALALAREALGLQEFGSASTRVRNMLYSLAAAATCSALWAATEGHRLGPAQQYLQRSVLLAGLSADPAVQFRVWGHAAVLYRRLGRLTDALAAADVSRSAHVTRSDPVFASLGLAHTAVHQGVLGDRTAAQRSLGHAQDALCRADLTLPRPPWMLFYDQAELELLALITQSALGQWVDAETHAHRSLALLRPELIRNRHRVLVFQAHAQLSLDALEPALLTIGAIPREAWHGRTGRLVAAFTTHLRTTAPDAPETRTWTEFLRESDTHP